MIYTAVKNYERALYFYEIVITTPAMTVSHIMLEAYKKYVLVSLIINGKVTVLCSYSYPLPAGQYALKMRVNFSR